MTFIRNNIIYCKVETELVVQSIFNICRFVDINKFPELYIHLAQSQLKMTVPELVAMLANRHLTNEEQDQARSSQRRPKNLDSAFNDQHRLRRSQMSDNLPIKSIGLDSELLDTMKKSLHPPHVVENGRVVPNAAFPFCNYGRREGDGVQLPEYGDRFCDDFQTTFNDHGLCYTFNNVNQVRF